MSPTNKSSLWACYPQCETHFAWGIMSLKDHGPDRTRPTFFLSNNDSIVPCLGPETFLGGIFLASDDGKLGGSFLIKRQIIDY